MQQPRDSIRPLLRTSLLLAIVGAGACAVIVRNDINRLWPSYLYGFLACWLVSVGGMGLLALGNLTGGSWAAVNRPFYLAATRSLWLVAILFVPIGVFTESIYPWASSTPEATLSPEKAAYLETVFFRQRAVGYFIVWLALAWLLSMVSRPELPPAATPGMRRMGAITLVLLVPTATFAAFDWAMSLEPEWYSSIYGALLSAGGVLAAHTLAVSGVATIGDDAIQTILHRAGMAVRLAEERELHGGGEMISLHTQQCPTGSRQPTEIYNDLGNLLLAFLMVNTYFALSQFIIIWTGNLPTEITWYLRRMTDGWQSMAAAIFIFQFVVPFMMLLSRGLKRTPRRLRTVSLIVLGMYAVHLYWMIAPAPAFTYRGTVGHVLNITSLAALGGAWLATYAWHANRCLVQYGLAEPQQH